MSEAASPPVATATANATQDATASTSQAAEVPNEACTACRSVKRKCLHDGNGARCTRCSRLDLECIYFQQKRGRKPGSSSAPRRKPPANLGEASESGSTPANGAFVVPPVNWVLQPPQAPLPRMLDRPPKRDLEAAFSAPSPPLNTRSPANGAPTSTLTGGFTLKRLLENREEEPPSHSLADAFSAPGRDSASGGRVFQDICTGGVLPEEDVSFIFEFYFQHLNPPTSLLDPVLHTPAFVRASSAYLFSAIITVTLRLTRPSLYPPALKFCKNLFGKSVEHCVCSLEFIQATALLSFWADAIDSGVARRLAYAVRCSYELRLDRKAPRPLPVDPMAARVVLNRERTWLHLCVADHRCSDQRSLPRMIPPDKIFDPVSWILEHATTTPCPSEVGLAPLVGIGRLIGLYNAVVTTRDGELPNEHLLQCLEVELQTWRTHWVGETTMIPLDPAVRSIIKFLSEVYQFQMDELYLLLAVSERFDPLMNPTKSPNVAFCRCVVSARSIIDIFRSEEYTYLYQDSTWIGVASAAIWLVQNFNGMTPAEQLATTACMNEGLVKCEEASTGNQSMAAYTGRLFRHLLSKTVATDASEPKDHLAPLGRASGSFVMASPSSHFDSQWQNILALGALGTPGLGVSGNGVAAAGPSHNMDENASNQTPFFNLMLKPAESLGDQGLVYPPDDDQLWQALFPLYGGLSEELP